ncbi:hypothetical protein GCK32_008844 [Trichostrongylus colubriformis]|uniref:SXP/RAL-2 family protein Ani s 5-like cation-binding domain-containing protein n=1 Tax=Trichostrongylus colubriformis TaxID=6319 RepID=A0AAN8IDG2_TRICO
MRTVVLVFLLAVLTAYSTAYHGPLRLPPRLFRFVTTDALREYHNILANKSLTIGQQNEKIDKWAKENDIGEYVKQYEANVTAHIVKIRRKAKQIIDYLPTAIVLLSEIMDNDTLTPEIKFKRQENLVATYPKAFHVLRFLFEQFMPRGGPYGPHGPIGPHGPPVPHDSHGPHEPYGPAGPQGPIGPPGPYGPYDQQGPHDPYGPDDHHRPYGPSDPRDPGNPRRSYGPNSHGPYARRGPYRSISKNIMATK